MSTRENENMSCDREEKCLNIFPTMYRRHSDFNYQNRFSLELKNVISLKTFLFTPQYLQSFF